MEGRSPNYQVPPVVLHSDSDEKDNQIDHENVERKTGGLNSATCHLRRPCGGHAGLAFGKPYAAKSLVSTLAAGNAFH